MKVQSYWANSITLLTLHKLDIWDVTAPDPFAVIWRVKKNQTHLWSPSLYCYLLCYCLHCSCCLSVFLWPQFTDTVMWQVNRFFLFFYYTCIIEPRADHLFIPKSFSSFCLPQCEPFFPQPVSSIFYQELRLQSDKACICRQANNSTTQAILDPAHFSPRF